MNLDNLQAAWNAAPASPLPADALRRMLRSGRHPLLRRIRRQALVEILGWTAFLSLYYTALDGDQKPLWCNLLLITALLGAIAHHALAFLSARQLVQGNDLSHSLLRYYRQLRTYAFLSLAARLLLMGSLLSFFTYGLSMEAHRRLALTAILLVFAGQLGLTARYWRQRLRRVKTQWEALQP